MAERVNEVESGVRVAFERYRDLIYLRAPLKASFMLTLSLVLLVSLLSAVWAAVFAARRLTAPLRRMAELTRSVAAGDYGTRLPAERADEIGFLADSFNEMTGKLSLARDEARDSHRQLDEQRTYLEAVLSRLTSGVLTTSHDGLPGHIQPDGAGPSSRAPLERESGEPLARLGRQSPRLAPFSEAVGARIRAARPDWREEVEMDGPPRPADPHVPGHRAARGARGRAGPRHRLRRRDEAHRSAAQPRVGGGRPAPSPTRSRTP